MALQQLPQFLALKSETNNRYLRYIHQDNDGVRGVLQFSGEEVLSPYAKFQVEVVVPAIPDNNNRDLVHIRSCYNNKYWRTADQNSKWIVAGADERQANQDLWSCTLFELIRKGIDYSQIQLRHKQSGYYLQISPTQNCLFIGQNSDVFTVIDRNALVILPKHLAFKVDVNGIGRYLRVQFIETHPYLQFSATEPTEQEKENEVVTVGDGSVRIKSIFTHKFWRRNSTLHDNKNWIWADSDDTTNRDSNTLFRPVKLENPIDDNVVALYNMANKLFCKRSILGNNIDNQVGWLAADAEDIANAAHLVVEEHVKSRTISILNFHRLTDARIYNRSIDMELASGEVTNPHQEWTPKTIWFIYEDTKASTWNTSIEDLAFTKIIPTTLTSDTPFILDEERIDISGNFKGTYQWGQPHNSSTRITHRVQVDVPPMSTMTVSLRATQAFCDIPFNYSKKDTLISQRTTYNEEVGLYTGVSLYNIHHETEAGQLPQANG